jgi:small-conductance mechanosensitive channel
MIDLSQFSPWIATGIAGCIGIAAALLAHRILGLVLLRATQRLRIAHSVVRHCQQPARALLPLFALQLVWQAAPNDLRFIEGLRHLNGLAMIAVLTWAAIGGIRGVAEGIISLHPANVEDNLQARRILTQTRVLARTAMFMAGLTGVAMMLMTFPGARQVGTSLLASAGVVGIVAGLAAQPVFSNLFAGLQIALAQPIRIDDVLIVEGEWGRVEEITSTYVVVAIWDRRRLIIPLKWFIDNPFQNWTRNSAELLGTAMLYVDYRAPLDAMREELQRIVEAAPEWDRRVCTLVVLEATERTMQIRCLVSAASSGLAFDLRCKVREGMIAFLQRHHPDALPRTRFEPPEAVAQPAIAPAGDSRGAAGAPVPSMPVPVPRTPPAHSAAEPAPPPRTADATGTPPSPGGMDSSANGAQQPMRVDLGSSSASAAALEADAGAGGDAALQSPSTAAAPSRPSGDALG